MLKGIELSITGGWPATSSATGIRTPGATRSTVGARSRISMPATGPSCGTPGPLARAATAAEAAEAPIVRGPTSPGPAVGPTATGQLRLGDEGQLGVGEHEAPFQRLDHHVPLPGEGHLQHLAGAAAHHGLQPAGVHPDVHPHAAGPHHHGLRIGEGGGLRDLQRDRLALGGDGDEAGAAQGHVEQAAGHGGATGLEASTLPPLTLMVSFSR